MQHRAQVEVGVIHIMSHDAIVPTGQIAIAMRLLGIREPLFLGTLAVFAFLSTGYQLTKLELYKLRPGGRPAGATSRRKPTRGMINIPLGLPLQITRKPA